MRKDRRALDISVINSAVPWAMAITVYSSAMDVVLCTPTGDSPDISPGAASGMAAGGLVYLMGGTPEQCCQAASCAVQNILDTICDPVAGLVQIPCINRNAMSAANTVVSANMIMGGFDSLIPLDQTAEILFRVGRQLPSELRCTCRGGLCITPCGQKLAAEQDARDNARTAAQA